MEKILTQKNKPFQPILDTPYYLPCIYPLITERLKGEGLEISPYLLPNINLLSLPAYQHQAKTRVPSANVWTAEALGFDQAEEILGFKTSMYEFNSESKGLEFLKSILTQNKLAIVSGTSYFLPYFTSDYLSDSYTNDYANRHLGIINHFYGVHGISSNTISIYDPTPYQYVGDIPMNKFLKSWYGDKGIPCLSEIPGVDSLYVRGVFEISEVKPLTSDELSYIVGQIIRTLSEQYLLGPIIISNKVNGDNLYFGHSAMKNLITDLRYVDEYYPSSFQQLFKSIFNMRFSRYFLRDFLEDKITEYHNFSKVLEELTTIISQWELVANILMRNTLKPSNKKENINQALRIMHSIQIRELNLFESVYESYKVFPSLKRKS
ncbi:hypothetical protein ACQKJC_12885 [Priestia koreensis]|uniref:hypothetical protein n=1 Tax=Priestia koreensis TaxID=284581 RepID=UPI003D0356E1